MRSSFQIGDGGREKVKHFLRQLPGLAICPVGQAHEFKCDSELHSRLIRFFHKVPLGNSHDISILHGCRIAHRPPGKHPLASIDLDLCFRRGGVRDDLSICQALHSVRNQVNDFLRECGMPLVHTCF